MVWAGTSIASAGVGTIRYNVDTREVQRYLRVGPGNPQMTRWAREYVKNASYDVAVYVVRSIKDFLRQNGNVTSGRLVASIGIYTPQDYQKPDRRNPSSPSDAVFIPITRGNQYHYIIGTNVPYAFYVEYGVTWRPKGGKKAVTLYSPKYGKKISVGEHTRTGVMFMQRGTERAYRNKAVMTRLVNARLARIRQAWQKGWKSPRGPGISPRRGEYLKSVFGEG